MLSHAPGASGALRLDVMRVWPDLPEDLNAIAVAQKPQSALAKVAEDIVNIP